MNRLLIFKMLMVLMLQGIDATDSIGSPETSHDSGQSKVKKGSSKKAASQKKKGQVKKEKTAASDSAESFKDDVVMEHPFDMRSMERNEIEIVKNNLNNFFRHNKQNVEDLKAATTREEKLIIFERIRQSNACLMQRYGDNLKKLKKDFYSLLHFLNEKQASSDPIDQEFIRTVEPDFFLINRFGKLLKDYRAL